jgi:hypothetical protein
LLIFGVRRPVSFSQQIKINRASETTSAFASTGNMAAFADSRDAALRALRNHLSSGFARAKSILSADEKGQAFVAIEPKAQSLMGLVRRQKLGIDPTLESIVFHLDPVPLPACSYKARAFGGLPNNRPVCRWRGPDVYAGTLRKNNILVPPRGWSLACPGMSGRLCGRLNS